SCGRCSRAWRGGCAISPSSSVASRGVNAPSPDGPPAESPLDLERIEWLPATPTTVTVLVVGRWRGDPPRHGAILIVEDGERRHFPADRYGEIEGVWTASFTIPNELRPDIERRL